jgi:Tol biopolymer transport system component
LPAWTATAISQVSITSTERLSLPAGRSWSAPRFSPDGQSVFLTTAGYRGIWQFQRATGTLQQINDDPGAGYGYTISPDGTHLGYRRTSYGAKVLDRTHEIVDVNLRTLKSVSIARGRNLSVPVYQANRIVYQEMEADDLMASPGWSSAGQSCWVSTGPDRPAGQRQETDP